MKTRTNHSLLSTLPAKERRRKAFLLLLIYSLHWLLIFGCSVVIHYKILTEGTYILHLPQSGIIYSNTLLSCALISFKCLFLQDSDWLKWGYEFRHEKKISFDIVLNSKVDREPEISQFWSQSEIIVQPIETNKSTWGCLCDFGDAVETSFLQQITSVTSDILFLFLTFQAWEPASVSIHPHFFLGSLTSVSTPPRLQCRHHLSGGAKSGTLTGIQLILIRCEASCFCFANTHTHAQLKTVHPPWMIC